MIAAPMLWHLRSMTWVSRQSAARCSRRRRKLWHLHWKKTSTQSAHRHLRHRTLVPELIRLLREAGRSDIQVFVGGVIPPQDYDFLRSAGVVGIYGPGSNIVECAGDILRLLGHNMPPAGDEMGAKELMTI